MDGAEELDLPLSRDERAVLRAGLVEWGGPARCTEELALAMGFASVADLHQTGAVLAEAIRAGRPLSPRDWSRALLATEIVFASDLVGSGVEWATTTGLGDEETLRQLRSLQRKILAVAGRDGLLPASDPEVAAAPGNRTERVAAMTARRDGVLVGEADPELDQRLSDELDVVNAAATPGVDAARELTVRLLDDAGGLVGGLSGWTWGVAAGIGLSWVRAEARGSGVGARLLSAFEDEARARGCQHVFVTSFTFQAPGFYERHGYREIFRWEGVPTPEAADVHLRKEL
ncbi:MAG: GNAT family N-acetyltransferase [Motilibacteraceae bacterium]